MTRGQIELDRDRSRIVEVADRRGENRLTVTYPELQNVAQGYRQRQVLADLLHGHWVANPAYWQNGRRVRPRRSELQSWQHFRERLTAAGYALEVHRQRDTANGDESYRLLVPSWARP